jgi:hypothetical protein
MDDLTLRLIGRIEIGQVGPAIRGGWLSWAPGGGYAQLVAAHMGERGAAQSEIEKQDAALAACIKSGPAHSVADFDRRLGQIDIFIEESANRGRTTAALSICDLGERWPTCPHLRNMRARKEVWAQPSVREQPGAW